MNAVAAIILDFFALIAFLQSLYNICVWINIRKGRYGLNGPKEVPKIHKYLTVGMIVLTVFLAAIAVLATTRI